MSQLGNGQIRFGVFQDHLADLLNGLKVLLSKSKLPLAHIDHGTVPFRRKIPFGGSLGQEAKALEDHAFQD